jgi:hypothetical protein
MMPTSVVALQILFILLPGFAAAYIVQMLAMRGTQTDFDKVIEASLYSFLIYAVFMVCFKGNLPFDLIPAKPPATDLVTVWHPKRVVALFCITVIFSFATALYINLDGNRFFRIFNLTERTARRSIWNDIFQAEASEGQIVQVELEDGRSVLGVLSYYSDDAEDCSIYLVQASWVAEDGSTIPIPGSGILLTKNSTIQSISFLNPQT